MTSSELRGELLDELSPRTTQKTMMLLHGIFRFAGRRGWANANPVGEAERVTVKRRPEFAVLSPDRSAGGRASHRRPSRTPR